MGRRQVREPRGPAALRGLPESHWKQWYDVRPPARADVSVDHVLVGPSGVYLIGYPPEGLRGAPYPSATDGPSAWTGTVGRCSEAAAAVSSVLPARYRSCVRPVLCLGEEYSCAETLAGVLVTSGTTLAHILRASPLLLSTSEVCEVAELLRRRLEPVPVVPLDRPRRRVSRWLVAVAAAAAVTAAATGAAVAPDLARLLRLG